MNDKVKFFVYFLIGIISLLNIGVSQAHNPGLSFAELELGENQIIARLVFAKKNIEKLNIKELADNFLVLTIDGKRSYPIAPPTIELEQNDGIRVELRFYPINGSKLKIETHLMDRFASGHRQFLSVTDQYGNTQKSILSAKNKMVVMELR